MIRCGNGDALRSHDTFADQLRHRVRIGPDDDVEIAFDQIHHSVIRNHVQLNARVQLNEAGGNRGQMGMSKYDGGTDAQPPPQWADAGADCFGSGFDVTKGRRRAGQ